jgi:hypothetical protein
LHAHLLIEVRWIDASLLARRWAEEVGTDDFCVVKVKDARLQEYARELAKYVCKPASLAAWTGEDIAAVMDAFKRRRTFGVFGRLLQQRKLYREMIHAARHERSKCTCGACNWQIEDPELDGIPR